MLVMAVFMLLAILFVLIFITAVTTITVAIAISVAIAESVTIAISVAITVSVAIAAVLAVATTLLVLHVVEDDGHVREYLAVLKFLEVRKHSLVDHPGTDDEESLYSAEVRAKSAKIEAEDMSRIAYQDALTHVKNKSAYNVKAKELAGQIEKFSAEFAIVMVDVNFLKRVNDTYGHEYGDKYLIGACEIICEVFKHSPVYRVGGDEFLAVLQGHDYEQRDALMLQLKERRGSDDKSLQPWENFSAACGIGVYQLGDSVEQVFQNADEEMYRNKVEMKGGRD